MKISLLAFSLVLFNAHAHKVGIRGRKLPGYPVCGPCHPDVCAWQRCSEPNIYLCTQAGTDSDATGGCNPGEHYWLENTLNCKACCNIESCYKDHGHEKPPPEPEEPPCPPYPSSSDDYYPSSSSDDYYPSSSSSSDDYYPSSSSSSDSYPHGCHHH